MGNLDADTIASKGGVTHAYARMLLAGDRQPSLALALRLYDATGEQVGRLTGLNEAEIAAVRKMAA